MKNTFSVTLTVALLLVGCSRDHANKSAASAGNSQPGATASGAKEQDTSEAKISVPPIAVPPPSAISLVEDTTNQATLTPAAADNPSTVAAPAPAEPAAADQATPGAAAPDSPSAVAAAATADPGLIGSRMAEWRLNADEIKDEYNSSGRIERTKRPEANAPTGPIDSNVITSAVREKFTSDAALAGTNLTVEVNGDAVTITGTAHAMDQIGRALAFALDTDGVSKAISLIKLNTVSP